MSKPAVIKDVLVQREADWMRSLGVVPNLRQIDEHVTAGLTRAAQRATVRARETPPASNKPAERPPENAAHHIAAADGYTLSIGPRKARPAPAKPPAPAYACNHCGTCARCRRERRALNILRMARAGDDRMKPLAGRIIGASMRAQAGAGEFAGLSAHDTNRVLTRIIEDVCDASVPIGGGWR